MTDTDLFTTIREQLFTSVIGDVLDVAGLCHQFLPPAIRSLHSDTVLVGRAMPVLEADCFGDTVVSQQRQDSFGLMFRALDGLQPGDVYITTGASPRYALWGGLMSTRAKALGAAGAVLDGFHRDTREIVQLGFPVFSTGSYAQDQRLRGRVIDFNCPIEFPNAVRVEPGDIVVGDIDGVVIIPKAHAEVIVADALAKLRAEEQVRGMIGRGQSTQSIFDETGVM
jgi:regulator of RNase E activity RraA